MTKDTPSNNPKGSVSTPPHSLDTSNTSNELQKLKERLANPNITKEERKALMKSIGQTQLYLLRNTGGEKIQSILSGRDGFEKIQATDLLALRREGVPLYKYLLIFSDGSLGPIKDDDLKDGSEFIVNFGTNREMQNFIGAGDILPREIREIEVNGKVGIRKDIGGRPGYYGFEGGKWKYRPIFDGDIIRIRTSTPLSEEENKKGVMVDNIFYKKRLAENILESKRLGRDPRSNLSYLSDDMYNEVLIEASQIEEEEKIRRANSPRARSERDFLLHYGEYIDDICRKTGVPQSIMLKIFSRETLGYDPSATNPYTGAHGLGQILDSTWNDIQNKHLQEFGFHGKRIDRNNPKDQILASIVYMAYLKQQRGSFEGALMGYFGVNSTNYDDARAKNKGVAKIMDENNLKGPEGFEQAYILWLGLKPGKIPSGYDTEWKSHLPKEVYGANGLPLGEVAKITRNSDGSQATWCGFTARQNAEKFGIIFPRIHNSSQALTQYSGESSVRTHDPTIAISHANEADANVIDIVFENTVGSAMGHRACGVRGKDGKWYVYDPYYKFDLRNDERTAIPYDIYMQNMLGKQKKILVGVGLHSSHHPSLKSS